MTSCCMNFAIIIQWIYFINWKKKKKNCHHFKYHIESLQYHIKTLQEEFAKKSNIPWIWRFIYGHKLPYMKKTRKKKQVCSAACFMAAEIKLSKDVGPSVRPSVGLSVCGHNHVCFVSSTILDGSISYLHIISSNFRRCVPCNICLKIQTLWNFGKFFEFVTLTLSSFELGSNMNQ